MFSTIFAISDLDANIKLTNKITNFFVSKNWDFGFQTPVSPVMEGIISFHDDLVIFLAFILGFVIYILWACISEFNSIKSKNIKNIALPKFGGFIHHPTLEIIWTIIPALILVNLALPSFALLYSIDEIVEPSFTFKVIGHQWYWSYEISNTNSMFLYIYGDEFPIEEITFNEELGIIDFKVFEPLPFEETSFDAYLISDEDLSTAKNKKKDSFRLLSVDNYINIMAWSNVRALVTSADVLHSWAIPSLGIKIDACPGRLNQVSLCIEAIGYFYGQCSELCGVNHGFMPIGIMSYIVPSGLEDDLSLLQELTFLVSTKEKV